MSTRSAVQGTLGVSMAVILGMNAIIGAGIFAIPAQLLRTAGPAGLITFAGVILGILGIALAFARVAQWYPERGAMYAYARAWAGPRGGAITLALYVIGLTVALSLLAVIAASYAEVYTTLDTRKTAVLMIAAMTAANLGGQRSNSVWQIVLLVLTIAPLALLAGLSLTRASFDSFIPFAPYGTAGMLAAVKTVVFAFFGFEAIPSLFSSLRDPERTVGKAIGITIMLVGIVYMGFTASIMSAFPASLFANPNTSLSEVLLAAFPSYTWIVHSINTAIIITILGTMHAMMWAVSALIIDGLHIARAHIVPSRTTTLVIIACAMSALALSASNIGTLFALVSISIVGSYAASIMPLLLNKQKRTRYDVILGVWGLASCVAIVGCAVRDLM